MGSRSFRSLLKRPGLVVLKAYIIVLNQGYQVVIVNLVTSLIVSTKERFLPEFQKLSKEVILADIYLRYVSLHDRSSMN